MKDQFLGIKTWDTIMLLLATLMLGLAALLASAIPVRNAAASSQWWHCGTGDQGWAGVFSSPSILPICTDDAFV